MKPSPTAAPLAPADHVLVMGVLNVTPDSFSDGGRYLAVGAAVDQAASMVREGADVLDVGGESTRPGARLVPENEELDRVVPVIEALAARFSTQISVDTRKPTVMRAAAAAGAAVVNDVSALTFSEDSLATAADLGLPVILMHAQGRPDSMQNDPRYGDVAAEVAAYLSDRVDACVAAGLTKENIWIDPGIGFGKTLRHNLDLIARLDVLAAIGAPIALGVSRKSFIEKIAGPSKPEDRLGGSLAALLAGVDNGARLVRVHDVAPTVEALKVHAALGRR